MFRFFIIFFFLFPHSGFTEMNESDGRKFYLHFDNNETGDLKWGNFLSCLKTVKFPNDPGPRSLNMSVTRLVITTIDKHSWIFSIKENESSVTLESITIDTHKYYTLKEKRHLFLRVVANCDTNQTIN